MDNLNSVTPVIACLGLAVSVISILFSWCQLSQSRFALGVNIILKLDALFNAKEMRADRHRAAVALIDGNNKDNLEPVLDFFESVGVLLRRKAIDKKIVWNYFSHWVLRYNAFSRDAILKRRKAESDNTYYENFEYLVKVLNKFEVKKRNLNSQPSFSKKELDEFIKDEMEIAN